MSNEENAIQTVNPLDIFSLEDNMKEIEPIIEVVKISHQTKNFAIGEDVMKTIQCVILHLHRANVWWKEPFGEKKQEDDVFPDCYSNNGIAPSVDIDSPQSPTCGGCPKNRYESGDKDRGKSCRNLIRLIIKIDGVKIPKILNLPPTSIRAMTLYLQSLMESRIPYPAARTLLELESTKNRKGIDYCVIKPSMVGVVSSREELEQVRSFKRAYSFISSEMKAINASDVPF